MIYIILYKYNNIIYDYYIYYIYNLSLLLKLDSVSVHDLKK